MGVLGDHTVLDTESQRCLGVDQVLQHGVHSMLGELVADHQGLWSPIIRGWWARPDRAHDRHPWLPSRSSDASVRSTALHRLVTAHQHAQRDDAHEIHPRGTVRQVTGRFPQGLLSPPQYIVVLPALRALEQPGSYCRAAAHALLLVVFPDSSCRD